jgi:hypothetical protein
MDTPKATAPDRMSVLIVGANITPHCAQKTLLPQPRVLYVAGSTQRVTRDVSYTKIYSKLAVKPIAQYTPPSFRLLLPQLTSLIPANFPLPRELQPVLAPEPPPMPYSRVVTHHQQPVYMTEQLSISLTEFRSLFIQLIQQNGMILNMLSTVLQKFTH